MNIKQNILVACVAGSLSMGAFAHLDKVYTNKDVKKKSCEQITTLDVAAALNLDIRFKYIGDEKISVGGKIYNIQSLKPDLIGKYIQKVESIEELMKDGEFSSILTKATLINQHLLSHDELKKMGVNVGASVLQKLNEKFSRSNYGQQYNSILIDCH